MIAENSATVRNQGISGQMALGLEAPRILPAAAAELLSALAEVADEAGLEPWLVRANVSHAAGLVTSAERPELRAAYLERRKQLRRAARGSP